MSSARDELYQFFLKIMIPAFVGISIKIGVNMNREKMSFQRILISFIVGVGSCYFLFPFIKLGKFGSYESMIVGVVAILSEKVMEYMLFKWNVDLWIGGILDAMREVFIRLIKK